MPGPIYTSDAEQDLRQIAEYIARDNLTAAKSWLEKVRVACELLATQSAIGERMQTSRFGDVRRHVVGHYLVYYQPTADGIEVVRVTHGAHDQGQLL